MGALGCNACGSDRAAQWDQFRLQCPSHPCLPLLVWADYCQQCNELKPPKK